MEQSLQAGLKSLREFTVDVALEDRVQRESRIWHYEMLVHGLFHMGERKCAVSDDCEQRLQNISTLLGWVNAMLKGDAPEPGVSLAEALVV